jgi:hypothetical protein
MDNITQKDNVLVEHKLQSNINNKNFLLYHHTGLGDHYVSNGLTRLLYRDKTFNKFYLLTEQRYFENVKQMFSDLPKLEVFPRPCYGSCGDVYNLFSGEKIKHWVIPIGHPDSTWSWYIKGWYDNPLLGYEYEDAKKYFKIVRNIEKEEKSYKEIINFDEEYAFIHDDPSRKIIIDYKKYINPKLKLIKTSELKKYKVFDFIKVIENAKEIHSFLSSFADFIILYNGWEKPKTPLLYLHNSYLIEKRIIHPDAFAGYKNYGAIII